MPEIRLVKQALASGFTILPNQLLRDTRLGYDDAGLLAELLSHMDGFELNKSWLQTRARARGMGRDALDASLGRLKAAGYLRVTRANTGEAGRKNTFAWTWEVADHPAFAEPVENPSQPDVSAGRSMSGKSGHGTTRENTAESGNGDLSPQVVPCPEFPEMEVPGNGKPGVHKKTKDLEDQGKEHQPPVGVPGAVPSAPPDPAVVVVEIAERIIRKAGVQPSAKMIELAARALRAGWPENALTEHLSAGLGTADNPPGAVVYRLTDGLPKAPPPPAQRSERASGDRYRPWCGVARECDAATRRLYIDDRLSKEACPRCGSRAETDSVSTSRQ